MLIKSEPMHIDTANKVTMSYKATGFTGPISILGFVLVPTYRRKIFTGGRSSHISKKVWEGPFVVFQLLRRHNWECFGRSDLPLH